MRPSSFVSAQSEPFSTPDEGLKSAQSSLTENARLAVVADEARLFEQDGGGVDDVGPLLLEQGVVFGVVRVHRVQRRAAEHPDVEVGVAEPEKADERSQDSLVPCEKNRWGKLTTGPPRRDSARCRGRSRR